MTKGDSKVGGSERVERAAASVSDCRHCGLPLPQDVDGDTDWLADGFCCRGCRAVYQVLEAGGLQRFYDLRGRRGVPVGELRAEESRPWLEPLQGAPRCDLDVQGIHCAGCVWLLEQVFERHGAGHIELNPGLGRAQLTLGEGYDLSGFVDDVESLGYRLGPAGQDEPSSSDDLLLRVGICAALAGNGMFYAAATYFGLDSGPVFDVLNQLSFGAASLAVLVGGSVFIRGAWQALRHGLIHLDLPIALGVLLSYAGAAWAFFARGEARYADTVTVFIALMLLGRWLRERVLHQNRRRLLEDRGALALLTRRIENGRPRLVRCVDVQSGDTLLLGRGDLVPVDVLLSERGGAFSLDWIDGESEPRAFAAGDQVPAGAFYVGAATLRAEVVEPFQASRVARLLRSTRSARGQGAGWWRRIATTWVVLVLLAAAGGFGVWWWLGSPTMALEVATAVLVVTCPCAFGIATPLAYELAHAHLRRGGLFVRSEDFLDRARLVTKVVFDKTGTLTTGHLRWALREDELEALGEAAPVLAALAAANGHPKSRAIAEALETRGVQAAACMEVREEPGRGVCGEHMGVTYRLGAPGWAGQGDGDVLFGRLEGEQVVTLTSIVTTERLRPDAARELSELRGNGYDVWVLSGDRPERVEGIARRAGVPVAQALGAHGPEAKAAWLDAHDPQHTLMIGDGLNDGLAATVAGCSGTPAVDRPFLASRCDFYFTTPGLGPVVEALRVAHRLRRTLRHVLVFAVVYNLGAVVVALAGWMQPWLAAVLMPVSSLTSLLYVAWAFSPRRRPRPVLAPVPSAPT